MSIRIYNTLAREKQVFEPIDPSRVTLYACGPTVYNYAHIGNARPAVIFDLLHRLLQLHYEEVVYARNITDVDDKINEIIYNKAATYKERTLEVLKKNPEQLTPRGRHERQEQFGIEPESQIRL